MKKSTIIISMIWAIIMYDALMQGVNLPDSFIVNRFNTTKLQPLLILFPFAFFFIAALNQSKKININEFAPKFITKHIDKKYGEKTTFLFLSKLRPYLLFMCALLTLGITGVISTYTSTKDVAAYNISAFFISGGLGLLLAFIIKIVISHNDSKA